MGQMSSRLNSRRKKAALMGGWGWGGAQMGLESPETRVSSELGGGAPLGVE